MTHLHTRYDEFSKRKQKQMKQFNYDLLENKKHLLEQDNSGSDRVYHGPNGTYASVTNMLYYMVTKPGNDEEI